MPRETTCLLDSAANCKGCLRNKVGLIPLACKDVKTQVSLSLRFFFTCQHLPFLFGYKTGVSPLQNDYKKINQLYVILL